MTDDGESLTSWAKWFLVVEDSVSEKRAAVSHQYLALMAAGGWVRPDNRHLDGTPTASTP